MFRFSTDETVRQPAVAGSFYPGTPDELLKVVTEGLTAAPEPAQPCIAAIAPHAGYCYSGGTAARALASLKGQPCSRVVLLGPAHTMGFSGAALPRKAIRAFGTPLGEVPIDGESVAGLAQHPEFSGPGRAHDAEHCLEVELPFLQAVLDSPPVVPILIGSTTPRDDLLKIARRLSAIVDETTRVVVSTDFTHHGHAYGFAPFPRDRHLEKRLKRLGSATVRRAAALDARGFFHQVEVSGDSVCGAKPVLVLLELLDHAFEGKGEVLEVTTSAEVSRSWDQVVTYAAARYTGRWLPWRDAGRPSAMATLSPAEGSSLVALARATLCSLLRHDESVAGWFEVFTPAGALLAEAGVFVSIHRRQDIRGRNERLRGCIGTIEPTHALVDAIVHNTCAAARDPRFPPLRAEELGQVEIEVSVMSPLRPIHEPGELQLGEHGVVISHAGRRALFLPQIAPMTGWDRDIFLSQLALKAGLPAGCWRTGARLEVFTAQVFSEQG